MTPTEQKVLKVEISNLQDMFFFADLGQFA